MEESSGTGGLVVADFNDSREVVCSGVVEAVPKVSIYFIVGEFEVVYTAAVEYGHAFVSSTVLKAENVAVDNQIVGNIFVVTISTGLVALGHNKHIDLSDIVSDCYIVREAEAVDKSDRIRSIDVVVFDEGELSIQLAIFIRAVGYAIPRLNDVTYEVRQIKVAVSDNHTVLRPYAVTQHRPCRA